MKFLQVVVVVLGVMIILATTALVVLVVKKGGHVGGGADAPVAQDIIQGIIHGNYITSYGVGDNLAVVVDQGNGQRAVELYDGKDFHLLHRWLVGK